MLSTDWYLFVRVQQDQGWSPSYSSPPAGWPVGSNTRDTSLNLLTLTLLTWRIWWAPNNVSKWQMGFNSAFKGLNKFFYMCIYLELYTRNYILEIQRDIIINVRISWYISPGILFLLNKICTPSTDFQKKKKSSKTKFNENPFSGSPAVHCEQTDIYIWRS
jgi:hypothetical protein